MAWSRGGFPDIQARGHPRNFKGFGLQTLQIHCIEKQQTVGPWFPSPSCYLFFADLPLYNVSPLTALPKKLCQWSSDSLRGLETPMQIPHLLGEIKQRFEHFLQVGCWAHCVTWVSKPPLSTSLEQTLPMDMKEMFGGAERRSQAEWANQQVTKSFLPLD